MAEKNSSLNEKQVIHTMEDFFNKAPQLPANIREVLVKIAPWIALVFGILGVLGGLSLVGVSPLAMGIDGIANTTYGVVIGLLAIVASVLLIMAFPKLQKNQYAGWRLLFWSAVIGVVSSLISLNAGTIIGAIVWGLIRFYILFQIKSYYK